MDSQTITVLATTAIAFLSSAFKSAGEESGKKIGEDIHQFLSSAFRKKPAAKEALADLKTAPDDADFQTALRVQLKKLLNEDPSFASQLQGMLKSAGETESGAAVIRQTAGDNARQFGQVFGDVSFGKE